MNVQVMLEKILSTLENRQDWQNVRNLEEQLSRDWGLGCDRDGSGYRKRLKRLSGFVLSLAQNGEKDAQRESELERLQRALRKSSQDTPPSSRQQLENLLAAFINLIRKRGESPQQYFKRLRAWQQSYKPSSQMLLKLLRDLAVLPANPAKQSPLRCLESLRMKLDQLHQRKADRNRLVVAEERWAEYLLDCTSDWTWIYLQALVRLAQECLQEKPGSPGCCELAARAEDALNTAIPELEKQGFLQPRAQGLYGLLATSALHRAKDPKTKPEERSQLIEKALAYARTSVEKEPESASERLILLQVLTLLGDSEEMAVQAEIARNLDSGPQTLQIIGKSFWERVAILRDRLTRRQLLRQAVVFFSGVLNQVESARFDNSNPLEQMYSHGWAHFWLGRFLCELGRTGKAIAHLRTAAELGFHPLESRVELAWTCLIARDRQQANRAFKEVVGTIKQLEASNAHPAAPEEQPLDALAFDAYAGWALLCCDWAPKRVTSYVAQAEQYGKKITRAGKDDRLAVLREAEGRALLTTGDIQGGIAKLEEALLLGVGGGACCYLGLAKAAQAKDKVKGALKRTEELYHLALESDVRGRYRREIRDLRHKLKELQGLPAGPVAPGAKTGTV